VANPLPSRMETGLVGELLVQLRLLEFGVQAAPPIRDTGNDLVALRGYQVRLVQVKSTWTTMVQVRGLPDKYNLLAVVFLKKDGDGFKLDDSSVHLISRHQLNALGRSLSPAKLAGFRISQAQVDSLFPFD